MKCRIVLYGNLWERKVENKVFRKIFGSKKNEVTKLLRNFLIYTDHLELLM